MKWRTLAAFCIAWMLVTTNVIAAGSFPTLIVTDGLLSDGQKATLQRDADLAQRTGVPTMFVVLRGDGTSAGSAQSFADTHRAEYRVESTEGADDGIVFLIHWVPDNHAASTVVYSAGEHAFATTGLNEDTISTYIERDVLPRLQQGQLFEASAFLIRLTRATGLYAPPPAREITGTAKHVQTAMTFITPVVVLAVLGVTFCARQPTERQRYLLVMTGLAISLILATVAVWTHSRIGIIGAGVILLTLLAWGLWTTRDVPRRATPWQTLLPDIALVLAFIGISLAINWQQVDLTPGDRDETRWINRAYYAEDLIDPFGPTWQDSIIAVGQPPLGSIAIGVGMAVQHQNLRSTGVWDYQYDKAWFTATGGYPTEEAMRAARRTNAVIGALTTGAAYVLGRLMSNRIGGIAAGAYVAWHPLHIVLSTQALSDQTLALMLMLAFIATYRFADKPTWGRAILLGVLLGLGGATKLTPLLLAPPLLAFGVLRLWFDRSHDGRRAGWMLVAQPFIAFASFVAIYPWLWENPIRRTWRLFAFRSSEMDAQTNAWPNALVEDPFHALARFGYKLTYTHSTSQKALRYVYDWLGIERSPVGIDLVIAAAGVVILLWSIGRYGLWTPKALVSVLIAGELALLAIGMKADFYRYHLPVVMIVSVMIAVAIGTLWEQIAAFMDRRSQRTNTSTLQEVSA